MASSLKASLVPDVGGGPMTIIGASGKFGFTSFHFYMDLVLQFSPFGSAGTTFAKAK